MFSRHYASNGQTNARMRNGALRLVVSVIIIYSADSRPLAQVAPPPSSVDSSRLEVSEELSESLANDLLALSVVTKDRDIEKTAQFFAQDLQSGPFPSQPTDTKHEVKWILSHGWTPSPTGVGSSGTPGSVS